MASLATLLRRATLAIALVLPLGVGAPAFAKEAVPASEDPVLEAKVMRIAAELRCLVCQNQTIADSHADLAQDLRNQVRDMLRAGKSEAEILAFMTDRYGDFVLYRPPVKSTTTLLWYGPGLLLVVGVIVLITVLRRRSSMPDDRFEPDEPEAAETPDASSGAAAR